MFFLNTAERANILDLPVSLPQTWIEPNSALVVSTVQVAPRQLWRLRWLNLHLVGVTPVGTNPQLVNTNMGLVYAGLFAGAQLGVPTGLPLVSLNVSIIPAVNCTNPYTFRDISNPDFYQILVVNNTLNLSFSVVLAGASRLYLNY